MVFKRNSPTAASWQVWAVSIALAGITWLVFGQTLRYDFINYDDLDYISKNPQVTAGLTLPGIAWAFSHTVSGNWHPLTMISHMLDCQIYGLRAGGHHGSNVLLHTMAVIVLFIVLRQMTAGPSSPRDESVRWADRTGNIWPSALVAALFAIHPLRAESVAWIAERKDVLSGLCFMLTLAAYLHYVRKPSLTSYVTVVLVFMLGLLAKPMLVTMPFVLLLLDYWPLRRFATEPTNNVESFHRRNRPLTDWKLIWEKIPLLLLSAVACGIAIMAQQDFMRSIQSVPVWVRIYNALLSYCTYIWKMIWPVKLALIYPYPAGVLSGGKGLLAIALLCALTYCAWVFRRKAPYIVTGWLWYLGMLVPVIGLVQVGMQARADRYTYLPQIGLSLAVTWAIVDFSASWRYRREILFTLAIPVILAFAWSAKLQTSYWKDSESIWRHSLVVNSNNAIAHHNLGYVLLKDGRVEEGIFHLQEALRISPDFNAGRPNPGNARVHDYLGSAFLVKGQRGEAIFHYERALLLRPTYNEVHDKLATAYWEEGQIDEAIVHWQQALSVQPADPHIHTRLGTALLRQQRAAEAIDHYERALAVAPHSTDALNNLALLLSIYPEGRFRNGQRAVQLAEQADQLSEKENPLVTRTLAAAYAESGRFDDAIAAAERALKLAIGRAMRA